ncbi:IS3 family transposase, partial [Pseudoramibacter porci]|nr:transposase [Pseudoramibacter porci]
KRNAALSERIRAIFEDHHGTYGVRRIYHELVNQGHKVNHKRV